MCLSLNEQIGTLQSATVYMDCDVNICLDRIEQRQRSSETNKITTEYLHTLKTAMDVQFKNASVLLDATCDGTRAIQDTASLLENTFT